MTRAIVILALIGAAGGVAHAHKPSDAHLRLAVDGSRLTGQISIAARDLDGALDLDADGNGDITWAETVAAAPRIAAYVQGRITIASGGACAMTLGAPALVDLTDGAYWTAPISADCPSRPGTLVVTYNLLFDIDAQHRGIIHLESPGAKTTVVVRGAKPVSIEVVDPTATTTMLGDGGRSLTLLGVFAIVAILARVWSSKRARPSDAARALLAFAIAEVATFLFVTAGELVLPWDWVEPGLIGAVAVVAAVNLGFPANRSRAAVALELGLAFGFALAHAFVALALPSQSLATLIAFALGAVVVQLALGAALAAATYALRRRIRWL